MQLGHEIKTLNNLMCRNFFNSVQKLKNVDEATIMHGWIVRYLYENIDKKIFQKDIEKEFSINRSTVTNILKLMEKKGYIVRKCVENDARLKKLELTEKGIQLYKDISSTIDILDKETLKGIDENDLKIFYKVLNQIRKNSERIKNLC